MAKNKEERTVNKIKQIRKKAKNQQETAKGKMKKNLNAHKYKGHGVEWAGETQKEVVY
jgi:hypothetical protein